MRLALLFVACLSVGCRDGRGSRQRPATTRTVTDDLGRTVTLGPVRRIVSLAPSSTEIVYALGAGDRVVGVDRYSDYPSATQALPRVGTDMEPSLEKILALRPDLILVATSANAQRSVEIMAAAGAVVYVSRADSLEAIFADVLGIAKALDLPAEGERVVREMRRRLKVIEARLEDKPRTTAAVVVWPEPLVVAARGSHVGDLLTAAGGRDVVEEAGQPFPTFSTERLVRLSPSVLIIGTHAAGAPSVDPILRLSSIPAVRDGRVHLVDGDLLFRPGPRVIDGVEVLVPLLHPELGGGGVR